MRSFVRFEGPLWRGWLNAAGAVRELAAGEPEVEVTFSDFWFDWDRGSPRPAPDAAADAALQALARPFFIRDLSRFPVLFFDPAAEATVFRFPPLGVQIAASRVGPSGSAVRALDA